MKCWHIVSSDTWAFGFGWLDERLYGEGGLEIYLGKRILCCWKKLAWEDEE